MGDVRKYLKKLAKIPVLFFYYFLIFIKRVDSKIIIFESNLGRNYSGNPRFIYEEMVARGLDQVYQCYFVLEDTSITIPGNAKKIKRISMPYFLLFAKAGFWISDTRMPAYLYKRKRTVYIQTWHGTPLKRLALDMFHVDMEGESDLRTYQKKFIKNVRTWDYLISQNSYSTEIFRRAFDFKKDILTIGYPRNDILLKQNNLKSIENIKKRFHLPPGKKILLYAPTWRDNEHYGSHQYKFSTKIDFSLLQEQLGNEYIILLKAHYLVGEQLDLRGFEGFIYQFGPDVDIAELYLISDMLITDYSSVMFDYSILNRPMLFFTYDLELYKDKLRGFYFDFLEEAPGPVVKTSQELLVAIQEYNPWEYKTKYEEFRKKYNHADQGNASEKVVDLILSYGG